MRETLVLSIALALGAHTIALAQAKPDFSGTWRLNQARSSRAVVGNTPDIPFPSQIEVQQSATDISILGTSVRQQPVSAVFTLDGSKANVKTPEGITETGEARLEGQTLIVTSKRSFSSPAGDVVVEFKEVWNLDAGALTIEKTRTQSGESSTQKAVYDKR